MGNVLDAPITEKETLRFERRSGDAHHHKVHFSEAAVPYAHTTAAQQPCPDKADADADCSKVREAQGERNHDECSIPGRETIEVPYRITESDAIHEDDQQEERLRAFPGTEYDDDGIAAAACSMQGWRSTMEDTLSAIVDIDSRPLNVRHIFCLFDGHGGESVADYCAKQLIDQILDRLCAAASGSAQHAGNPAVSTDPGARRRQVQEPWGGPETIALHVREACRAVDAQVKGKFSTQKGKKSPPRVHDSLDVTPPPPLEDSNDSDDFSEEYDDTLSTLGKSLHNDRNALNGRYAGTGRYGSVRSVLARERMNTGRRSMVATEQHRRRPLYMQRQGRKTENKFGSRGQRLRNTQRLTRDIRSYHKASTSKRAVDPKQQGLSTCGTTSLVIVVSDHYVICCNTGDSRAVLASGGASRPLSTDHKPEVPSERKRIKAAGGTVEHNRVEGRLAVSRCIGDHTFKSDPRRRMDEQMVICDPEATVVARSDADEFIILACDGVWNVMGNDEACFFVRKCIQEGDRDLGLILEKMEDACLAKQSMDNISIVLITFRAAWEEGLLLHKSARYILEWGCDKVLQWLSANNFAQYQDDFEQHRVDGEALLGLTAADLHHKLHLKKVGLRKRLWQKLSPLRLGYLAWKPKELAAWLEHVDLQDFQDLILQEAIDGRALSTLGKADLRALAANAGADKATRRKLYGAISALKETGEGSEWVVLGGVLDGFNVGGSSEPDLVGRQWHPSPVPPRRRTSSLCSTSSSATSSVSDEEQHERGGATLKPRHVNEENLLRKGEIVGDGSRPTVVGQGHQDSRTKGMISSLDGARQSSRVSLHKPSPEESSPISNRHVDTPAATTTTVIGAKQTLSLRRASNGRKSARVNIDEPSSGGIFHHNRGDRVIDDIAKGDGAPS